MLSSGSPHGFRSRAPFAAVAVVLALAGPVRAVVIDAFATAQMVAQSGTGASGNTVDGPGSGLLGGERDVQVTIANGAGTLRADVGESRAGAFSHAAAGRVRGSTALTYDGNDDDAASFNPTGLGGVDLTVGGSHTSVAVALPFADLGAAVSVAVWSDATHCSLRTLPAPAGTTPADGRVLQFRFGDFGTGPGCTGPAVFSHVGAVTLAIDGTGVGATDVSIELFETMADPTPTATPTQPPTATPTITPSPTPVCGDGITEGGEACDDGNAEALDGCENDCVPSPCEKNTDTLIPGYCNTKKNDCNHEFCTAFPALPTERYGGLPGNIIRCVDDDPACDAGPAGDHACTLRVALCFNVRDPRLACYGQPPKGVSVVRLRRVDPRRSVDVANRAALEAALIGLGGTLQAGPGASSPRVIEFDPPLTAHDQCTRHADFKVPLRVGKQTGGFLPGKKLLTVITIPPKLGTKAPKQDSDYLVLECVPR